MRLKVLPYVTVDVDDRLRGRLQTAAERLRVTVRGYLLSAADDVDHAGDRVRNTLDAAVSRVDDAVGRVTDRLDADARRAPDSRAEAS
jgi:arylsulfatase A-like enzyme